MHDTLRETPLRWPYGTDKSVHSKSDAGYASEKAGMTPFLVKANSSINFNRYSIGYLDTEY